MTDLLQELKNLEKACFMDDYGHRYITEDGCQKLDALIQRAEAEQPSLISEQPEPSQQEAIDAMERRAVEAEHRAAILKMENDELRIKREKVYSQLEEESTCLDEADTQNSELRVALQRPRVPDAMERLPESIREAAPEHPGGDPSDWWVSEVERAAKRRVYLECAEIVERALAAAPDQPAELEPWEDDAALVARAMRAIKKKRNEPFWCGVKAVFQHGSGYSQALCRRFGLDPYTGEPIQGGDTSSLPTSSFASHHWLQPGDSSDE